MTELLVIFSLLVLNGIFAMAEIALISARKARMTRLAESGNRGAALALRLTENPERFLSTVQVGITLVSVLNGAFGGATLAPFVAPFFESLPGLAPYADRIAFAIVVVFITYASIVIGELVPKGLALRHPEAIASFMARPMGLLSTITKPVVWFLELSTRVVLRLFGTRGDVGDSGASVDDVEVILREGIVTGMVRREESEMVEGVFDLREVLAEEVMRPKPLVAFLPHDAPVEAYWPIVSASDQTVFPVYRQSRDSVVGLVSLRALFSNLAGAHPKPLAEVCQEPLFVAETQSALSLLNTLRTSPLGAALVADEFGTVRGLITLEDIVEEVVGDLRPSASKTDRPTIRARQPGTWLADGLVEIDEVEEVIPGFSALIEEEKEPFQTLAGYIVHRLDRLPEEGESFEVAGFRFEIIDMDRQRIDKVGIGRLSTAEEAPSPAADAGQGPESSTGSGRPSP